MFDTDFSTALSAPCTRRMVRGEFVASAKNSVFVFAHQKLHSVRIADLDVVSATYQFNANQNTVNVAFKLGAAVDLSKQTRMNDFQMDNCEYIVCSKGVEIGTEVMTIPFSKPKA